MENESKGIQKEIASVKQKTWYLNQSTTIDHERFEREAERNAMVST